ncbi:MAG: hypothetical protein GF383_14030 [Candidatus Lokiarchaeota archaeon]|nr:hypothetical protein [Candidatus Lokiarchaeota archaeon]MBD3342446.1 hypothetical protein [Candidatus Lokiarchaeota archaeon]
MELVQISEGEKIHVQKGEYLKIRNKMIYLNLNIRFEGESYIFAFVEKNKFKIWMMYTDPQRKGIGTSSLIFLNSVIVISNANVKICAVNVLKSASGFWAKMKDYGLIAEYTSKNR